MPVATLPRRSRSDVFTCFAQWPRAGRAKHTLADTPISERSFRLVLQRESAGDGVEFDPVFIGALRKRAVAMLTSELDPLPEPARGELLFLPLADEGHVAPVITVYAI